MYAALWRILPGPTFVKLLEALVLLMGTIAVLFTWVYPWAEKYFNLTGKTVH